MTRFLETRKGFTLTEVLMAMFVMAIGMLSLLALFPVAFQNAKWALDNEQVARGAANAQSTSEMPHVNVTNDPALGLGMVVNSTAHSVRNDDRYRPTLGNVNSIYRSTADFSPGQLLNRFSFLVDTTVSPNVWTYYTGLTLPGVYLPINISGTARIKTPPVFVDPQVADFFIDPTNGTNLPIQVGCTELAFSPFASLATAGTFPALDTATLRPRRSVGIPRSSILHLSPAVDLNGFARQTESTLGDEIDFGSNGQPLLNTATQYARQRRFTWAYMCLWPEYANPDICEVTAVVFNSRPTNSGLATLPPGEKTYGGHNGAAFNAGTDVAGLGRIFVKGLNQATILLGPTPTPAPLKANDWILDSTMILPEYQINVPTVPFLDEYNPAALIRVPGPTGPVDLRPGLVGGHFYKVLDISEVRSYGALGPTVYYQTITLDRPAKSDGFSATILSGIADVITKGAGKMPQR